MTTCSCCGSENTLVKRGKRWHCTVCHNRGAYPSPSEREIEEQKRELREKAGMVFDSRDGS